MDPWEAGDVRVDVNVYDKLARHADAWNTVEIFKNISGTWRYGMNAYGEWRYWTVYLQPNGDFIIDGCCTDRVTWEFTSTGKIKFTTYGCEDCSHFTQTSFTGTLSSSASKITGSLYNWKSFELTKISGNTASVLDIQSATMSEDHVHVEGETHETTDNSITDDVVHLCTDKPCDGTSH
ncbi:hypothetical protein ACFLZ9_01060 [Patescibacteria group bacterium]